jgi:2-polyprenyl-6-hydroxyphenyl methylase/3-demethylubiquinone-9 3-methyltransferase
MHLPKPDSTWSEDWRTLYNFDVMQFFGGRHADLLHSAQFGERGTQEFRNAARAYRRRLDAVLAEIKKWVSPPASIIDLGAAQGNFSLLLAQAGYSVTWNDYLASREGYVRLKMDNEPIKFLPGNAFELGLEASFDAVLALELIEHVAHPDDFLRSCAKLVKPGGVVIVSTPNGDYLLNKLPRFSNFSPEELVQFESRQFAPDGDGHIFALHEDEIRRLVPAAGLQLEQLRFFDVPSKVNPLDTVLPKIPGVNRLCSPGVLFACKRGKEARASGS